jgi:SAM-dependent methyltransferase
MAGYADINAETIGRWIDEGWEWGEPIDHETFLRARAGSWEVKLTPTRSVPREWFGSLTGACVLGLASGGGQQCPIFAAAGAHVTVLDYTPAQLESERLVSEREGFGISIVRADMTEPLPFPDETFDLVFNPVSLCYIREVEPVWNEVARIMKPGGILLTGFDTIINFIVDGDEREIVWSMPFDPLDNPAQRAFLEEDDAGLQFGHSLDEMLGGLLRAGFSIEDLYEDTNGEGRLHEMRIPTYLAVRAVKRA